MDGGRATKKMCTGRPGGRRLRWLNDVEPSGSVVTKERAGFL